MKKEVKYYLDKKNNDFVIENYNLAKPFANFFTGIAGEYGIPMWVFYVNRAQAISSFGTKDKDHAILEFFPANRAWQITALQGFRTFIKLFKNKKIIFYEPFHNGISNLNFKINNQIHINSADLKIKEENLSLGLEIKVEYFTIPNDNYAGLARIVTIKNTLNSPQDLQLLDGLPQIVPYGVSNLFLKKLARTIEAWMKVENLNKKVPFYKLDVDPTDRPEVVHIEAGNFYLGFYKEKDKTQIIKPIVDPDTIFGIVTDFSCPHCFLNVDDFIYPKNQITKNKTPCGFLLLNLEIPPQQEKSFYSIIGYMKNLDTLNASIPKIASCQYLLKKQEENRNLIAQLQKNIETISNLPEFDLYAKQTYLDNILRGGYPFIFKSDKKANVFYLYSRKHGDLERDYNKFELEACYFSQGNGNYRDINQNRRSDIWFNPEIKEDNLLTFFNLIQPDGFNPLVLKEVTFLLEDRKILKDLVKNRDLAKLNAFLNKPFTPGELISFLKENKIKLKVSYEKFLNIIIAHSLKNQAVQNIDYGFWIDHWAYNLDLLESYLGIYPEKLKEVVFERKDFTFYDNYEFVKPRHQKYILIDGKVRQLQATFIDNEKNELIKKRLHFPHLVRTQYGQGEIYQTTLINKLFCLLVNKLTSLDPLGIGVEMEANRPNWFDALNGLPALFGSSTCETFELKRLILFIKKALIQTKIEKIHLSQEILDFLNKLNLSLNKYFNFQAQKRDYLYWDNSHNLKETYWQRTRLGFSGKEIAQETNKLINFLDNALRKVEIGLNKALDKKRNIYYAYFINEVVSYKILKKPFVKPLKFIQKKLPFFLESQMHALRVADEINIAKRLYQATQKSLLYDKKLKMYKVTAPLKDMPLEIGRCRVFTPGWLENESIWLHMEYKYLLEVLKQGLYAEFYKDFKNVLIPFQPPQRYGRSILENSSFIVSSAFPDKNLWGNGFVARLSGSTAEFLQIWLIMNLGLNPFFLNEKKELNLRFQPILAGWLFREKEKTYSFTFLSKTKVVYHNPKRKNTFGKDSVKPKKIIFYDKDGNYQQIPSDTIPHPYAYQIREGQIKNIDIFLE